LLTGQTTNAVSVNIDGLGSYTLKVANTNGCVNTSNTVLISDAGSEKLFIYPNPSGGVFQVRFFSDVNNLQPRMLNVYDSKGALVYSSKNIIFGAYTSITVDLSNKSTGIYSVYLLDNDGKKIKSAEVLISR
jgi:hypothetical protein